MVRIKKNKINFETLVATYLQISEVVQKRNSRRNWPTKTTPMNHPITVKRN